MHLGQHSSRSRAEPLGMLPARKDSWLRVAAHLSR